MEKFRPLADSSSEEESDQQTIYSNYVNLAQFVSQSSTSNSGSTSNGVFIPSAYSNNCNYSYGGGGSQQARASESSTSASSTTSTVGAMFPFARLGHSVDWNKDYQTLLELGVETTTKELTKYLKISALSQDFVRMATRWGKIIIEEFFLPANCRTIDPCEVGGQAGGLKYIYNGILFKLQTDWKNIYGGDFFAMKSGGLELKGLMRYYGCPNIHVPLMAIIDHRGFRLVAISILPINDKTLIYGSSDAGRSVFATNEELNGLMQDAATTLNIKGHLCGMSRTMIYGPIDIEGHLGTDNRFYVLDFGRVFPPTAEDNVQKTFLYRIFRPEFVKKYKVPLCPDAFSPFSRYDPEKKTNETEVVEATHELLNVTIPNFAFWLDKNYQSLDLENQLSNLVEVVHREGVNVRYLGFVRRLVKQPYLKKVVLMEMVARTIKNRLRQELRDKMKAQSLAPSPCSDESFDLVFLDTFNLALGWSDNNKSSTVFWSEVKKAVLAYFSIHALDEFEKEESYELRPDIIELLFPRLCQLMCVKLAQQAKNDWKLNSKDFKLVSADIKQIAVKVKQMNSISYAEGKALGIQAMEAIATTKGSRHHDRLFSLAMSKFDFAIRATPDNTVMLVEYGDMLARFAALKTNAREEALTYFEKAVLKYSLARYVPGLSELAIILQQPHRVIWEERKQAQVLANECYMEMLRVDPHNEEHLLNRAHLLVSLAAQDRKLSQYELAGKLLRQAVLLEAQGTKISWLANGLLAKLNDLELAPLLELFPGARIGSLFAADKAFDTSIVTDNIINTFASTAGTQMITRYHVQNLPQLSERTVKTLLGLPDLLELNLANCRSLVNIDSVFLPPESANATPSPNPSPSFVLPPNSSPSPLIKCRASLQSLNLQGTPLTAIGFDKIVREFSALRSLNVSNCSQLDGTHFVSLAFLLSNNLTDLDLSFTKVPKSNAALCFINFNKVTALKRLNLSGCGLNPVSFSSLVTGGRELSLTDLELDECTELNDDALQGLLLSSPSLIKLSIARCSLLSSRIILMLGTHYSHFENLNIDYCTNIINPNDTHFSLFVQNNPHVTHLSMRHTRISDAELMKLSLTKDLTVLNLDATRISDFGLRYPTLSNVNLTAVSLTECQITGEGLNLITKVSPKLTSLVLARCSLITVDCLVRMAQHCPKLTSLDLSGLENLTNEGLAMITHHLPALTHFVVSDTKIGNEGIVHIGHNLHDLESLDCSGIVLISNLTSVAQGCPRLHTLNLSKCKFIKCESISVFQYHTHLKRLLLADCSLLDDTLIVAISSQPEIYPALERLDISGHNRMSDNWTVNRPTLDIIRNISSSRKTPLKVSGQLHSSAPHSDSSMSGSEGIALLASGGQAVPQGGTMATRALMRDLKVILKEPLPLVSAHPLESNIFEWHCNLKGPEKTPYEGGIFHLKLTFPPDYPNSPPSGTVLTPLPHPHVLNGRICLDILSDFSSYFATSEQDKNTTATIGWCSAYSVQTILLQLQTFLMDLGQEGGLSDKSLDNLLSEIPAALKATREFKCDACSHRARKPWPSLDAEQVVKNKVLTEAEIVAKELKCYHTRISFKKEVIGIGISVKFYDKKAYIRSISSPLDLLSYSAFLDGVREAVYDVDLKTQQKIRFTHWLPLYINGEHAARAKPLMEEWMCKICNADTFSPHLALHILPKLMNTNLVSILSGETITSMKSLEGYLAFHRLLIMFVQQYPELLAKINNTVSDFIAKDHLRKKQTVPDLGDFLAYLSVSDFKWEDVREAYILESFTRNVYWINEKYPELMKETPDPIVDKNRISKTFHASQISLKLLCFQAYFLPLIHDRPLDEIGKEYDGMYGRPTLRLKSAIFEGVKLNRNLESFAQFFRRIGMENKSDEDLLVFLRSVVTKSAMRGYHKTSTGDEPRASGKRGGRGNNRRGGGGGRNDQEYCPNASNNTNNATNTNVSDDDSSSSDYTFDSFYSSSPYSAQSPPKGGGGRNASNSKGDELGRSTANLGRGKSNPNLNSSAPSLHSNSGKSPYSNSGNNNRPNNQNNQQRNQNNSNNNQTQNAFAGLSSNQSASNPSNTNKQPSSLGGYGRGKKPGPLVDSDGFITPK